MSIKAWEGSVKMDRSTARSFIYKRLSLCYVYPDEKVYASIAEDEWIIGFKDMLRLLDEKNFDDCLRPFEQAIFREEEGEQSLMAREYTRLFIDSCPHVIAPPYESFYMEKEGMNSTEKTLELLHFYHETGFILKEGLHDLPDHIAHELEFMGVLADQESQAAASEKIKLEEIQLYFFSRFILPWITSFCEKITKHSHFPFYQYLGKLTIKFIEFETNYLGVSEEGPLKAVGQASNA